MHHFGIFVAVHSALSDVLRDRVGHGALSFVSSLFHDISNRWVTSMMATVLLLMFTWRWVLRPSLRYGAADLGGEENENSVIVITGCDYGFGKAMALRFNALGSRVVAGVLSSEAGKKLRAECDHPERMVTLVLDVTSLENIEKVRDIIVSELNLSVKVLVNNAGISAFGWAEHLPISRYEMNANVNFLGAVRMTSTFLPHIRASKGRIVNIGSIGARMPSSFGSAYLSTKAAMVSYSECLRQEVFRFGVRVITVEPGFFATELLANGAANGEKESAEDSDYPSYAKKMEATSSAIRFVEHMNGGKGGLSRVVGCVVDAAISRFPLTKYTVGYDAILIRWFLSRLPAWLIDWVQTLQDA